MIAYIPLTNVFAEIKKQSWNAESSTAYFSSSINAKNGSYLIGQYHDWIIQVKDKRGHAVNNAKIKMSGGMMAHGHGLPSQPLITRYLGEGNYLIEGVLFNMPGDWTLLFNITAPAYKDHVRFDVTLNN